MGGFAGLRGGSPVKRRQPGAGSRAPGLAGSDGQVFVAGLLCCPLGKGALCLRVASRPLRRDAISGEDLARTGGLPALQQPHCVQALVARSASVPPARCHLSGLRSRPAWHHRPQCHPCQDAWEHHSHPRSSQLSPGRSLLGALPLLRGVQQPCWASSPATWCPPQSFCRPSPFHSRGGTPPVTRPSLLTPASSPSACLGHPAHGWAALRVSTIPGLFRGRWAQAFCGF